MEAPYKEQRNVAGLLDITHALFWSIRPHFFPSTMTVDLISFAYLRGEKVHAERVVSSHANGVAHRLHSAIVFGVVVMDHVRGVDARGLGNGGLDLGSRASRSRRDGALGTIDSKWPDSVN